MKEEEESDALAKDIGKRLMWVRLLAGKTQEEVAAAINAQGGWSRWENGVRIIPPRVALEVCRRMQISMDYIYRGHLTGVHPELAKKLNELYPGQLVLPPPFTGWIQ